jgi:hypothetical protein
MIALCFVIDASEQGQETASHTLDLIEYHSAALESSQNGTSLKAACVCSVNCDYDLCHAAIKSFYQSMSESNVGFYDRPVLF